MENPPARLILASASPRRAALLREAGLDFEIRPSQAGEPPFAGGDVAEYVESLARRKAASVPGDLVLGADTVVALDGEVLGKPADLDEAAAMLRRLSGRRHQVLTGVALRDGMAIRWGHARSEVTFRTLEPAEILRYVATGEPMDKAGAYAIQGGAAAFVEGVVGDRDTVIGLPMALVRRLLAVSHPV
ncbi:MAG TPA: Maf family protein [Candidatus Dormibacteraeota bacterium]|nr:Maf family protein [Candidatus Dormibacteraeota bacterium]